MTPSDQQPTGDPQRRGSFRLAAVCLALGVVAIPSGFLPGGWGIFIIIPAILFGHFTSSRTKRFPDGFTGRTMTRAGLTLSYLGLPTLLLFAPAYFHAKSFAGGIKCTSKLKMVCLAARVWANQENGDVLPSNWIPSAWLSYDEELSLLPDAVICPADTSRKPAASWVEFTTNNVSYGFVITVPTNSWSANVYLRCPIHGHEIMTDGTLNWGQD